MDPGSFAAQTGTKGALLFQFSGSGWPAPQQGGPISLTLYFSSVPFDANNSQATPANKVLTISTYSNEQNSHKACVEGSAKITNYIAGQTYYLRILQGDQMYTDNNDFFGVTVIEYID